MISLCRIFIFIKFRALQLRVDILFFSANKITFAVIISNGMVRKMFATNCNSFGRF